MRLVDADAFERAVMFSDDEDLQDVIYRLRDFPTAQPHTGHWTSNNYGISDYCSECGKSWINDYVEHKGEMYLNGETPIFCPNCGARMVKE